MCGLSPETPSFHHGYDSLNVRCHLQYHPCPCLSPSLCSRTSSSPAGQLSSAFREMAWGPWGFRLCLFGLLNTVT